MTAPKKNAPDKILAASIPAVFLAFTFCVFGPLEIYMTNVASFPFKIHELLLGSLLMFLCTLVVFALITLSSKSHIIVTSSIFGLAMAVYIQGNWMFIDYGQMDGTAIDWGSYGIWPYLNLLIWAAAILIPVAISLVLKDKDRSRKALNWIAIGILAMQCITLGTLALTTTFPQSKDHYVARDERMLELSKNKNIIVMLFDGFQASYFQQAIADVPDAQEIFKDFVFFDNAVGTSLYSEEGSATILTGEQLRADLPFDENIDYIYSNSEFFPALEKNGYDTRYYIQSKLVSGTQDRVIENVLEMGSGAIPLHKTAGLLSKVTAFRYMPHILKQYFWFSYDDIDSLRAERELDIEEFSSSDSIFNQEVLDGKISATLDENVYRLYYFKGVHPPYTIDENGSEITYDVADHGTDYVIDYVEDIHDNQMMYRQTLGSIRIMANLIQALKDEGIYDKTDIVITADHGWENRYNPILLIKSKETVGDFSVSHAPVSYISDLAPTILSLIDGDDHGDTVFDHEEDEERERSFMIYSINAADRSYNSRDIWYTDSLEVTPEDFYTRQTANGTQYQYQYQVGEEITFTDAHDENDGRRYFKNGVSGAGTGSAWSLNKKGKMLLNLGTVSGDLIAEFCLDAVYAPPQRFTIRCGGLTLFDQEIRSAEAPVRFIVPKSCMEDGKLTLDLEYPDAISPYMYAGSEDTRELAFSFHKIRFYPVENDKERSDHELGSDIVFTHDDDGRRYFLFGTSIIETDFTWSLDTHSQMLLHVGEGTGDLTAEFRFKMIYAAPQTLTIRCGGSTLYDAQVHSEEEAVRFTVPESCIKDGMLILDLEYPDAVSPQSLGRSEDSRVLAFAFQNIRFDPVG